MNFSHVPAYEFGHSGKCEMEKNDFLYTPGPGNYKLTSSIRYQQSPSWKICSSERDKNPLLKNSSPGAINVSSSYNYVRPKSPSYSFGSAKRGILSNNINYPGPGQYNISNINNNNLKSKSPKKNINYGPNNYSYFFNSPGPGHYYVNNNHLKNYPAWKIGSSGRNENSIENSSKNNSPGPGDYDVNKYNNGKNGPKYSFGPGYSTETVNGRFGNGYKNSPGPGQYHIPCSIVDVSSYEREKGNFDPNFKFI